MIIQNTPKTKIGSYEYDEKYCLGAGYCGRVYQGIHSETQYKVAIKVIKNINPVHNQRQVEVLKFAQSANVVMYHQIFEKENIFILELCDGDLKKELKRRKKLHFSQHEILDIIKPICNGFKVLYQNKIIHRDLKPQNILVKDKILKIADFGFARFVQNLDKESQMTYGLGTPVYMSPQVLQKKKYNSKCDVWSLGIILYQLIYSDRPFQDSILEKIKLMKNSKSFLFSQRQGISQQLIDLVKKMLQKQEYMRISWPEIFLHRKIRSPDFIDQITQKSVRDTTKVIKYYKGIYRYFFATYYEFKCKNIENWLPLQQFLVLKGALIWSVLHYCSKLVDFMFQKDPPHPSITNDTWRVYRSTNEYWKQLKEIKSQQQQIQNFHRFIIQQIRSSAISQNFNQKLFKQEYLQIIFHQYPKKIQDLNGGDIKPKLVLERFTKIKNPSKTFSIYQEQTDELSFVITKKKS